MALLAIFSKKIKNKFLTTYISENNKLDKNPLMILRLI